MHPDAYPFQIPLQHPADDELALHLPFQEGTGGKVYDLSGNENHGILSGPTWVPSGMGWVLNFTGYPDLVNAGTDLQLPNGTISMWVNPSVIIQGAYAGLFAKSIGGSIATITYLLIMNAAGTKLQLEISNGSSVADIISASAIFATADTWYHLTAVWDSSYLYLFKDGVSIATPVAHSIVVQSTTHTVKIGGDSLGAAGGTVDHFKGLINNVLVHRRGFSVTEIMRLYEQTRP